MSEETTALTQAHVEERVTALCRDMGCVAEVENDEEYSLVGGFLLETKRLLRQVDEVFDPPIQAAHAAHKAMVWAKKKVGQRLLDDEARLKQLMADYGERKLAMQREAELKAQLSALAEAQQRQEQQAAQLQAQGRTMEAEQVLAAPAVVPTVVLDKTPPKVAGVTLSTTWDFEVDDPMAVPREYLCVDETKIRGVVRALKENTRIPGVKVFPRKGVSARGA